MYEGKYTGAMYIDLSKAFDTISHPKLINTLQKYGVSGNSLIWFTDYLFCRSRQVSFQGTLSTPQSLLYGVPQGSILGPLLFIIYFNDAVKTIIFSQILMYEDDTIIFSSHKNIDTIKKTYAKIIMPSPNGCMKTSS